jgi:hypothetical protein
MAMTVYIGSMCMIALALPCELRNRHENWASSSKHGHHYMRRRLEIQLQSLPWRQSSSQLQQQRAGRLRVNCSSSTADPARDSRSSPIPTLYDFLEISQHVGEFLRTSVVTFCFAADRMQSLKAGYSGRQ